MIYNLANVAWNNEGYWYIFFMEKLSISMIHSNEMEPDLRPLSNAKNKSLTNNEGNSICSAKLVSFSVIHFGRIQTSVKTIRLETWMDCLVSYPIDSKANDPLKICLGSNCKCKKKWHKNTHQIIESTVYLETVRNIYNCWPAAMST